MLETRARKSNIMFKTEYIDKMLMTNGDPILFWQTMMNITLNSMQAMPEGGTITITVSEIQKKSDENQNQSGKVFAQICIKDEGKGIESKVIDNIFKPFYTTKPDGTGLGLAIVKRIADENHWNIDINTKSGEGTEFFVQIPIENNYNE
jgi:signal transduction histidine kinase